YERASYQVPARHASPRCGAPPPIRRALGHPPRPVERLRQQMAWRAVRGNRPQAAANALLDVSIVDHCVTPLVARFGARSSASMAARRAPTAGWILDLAVPTGTSSASATSGTVRPR